MTTSIRSTALEPSPEDLPAADSVGGVLRRLLATLPVYGLVWLTLALLVFFSILLPHSFPTLFNLRSVLGDKSIIALLALAAMIPMVAGKIDLTVGYGIVLWHILAISLQLRWGMPWPVAGALVVACGAAFGLLNALLVERAQIDAFIATLGTGTVIYAVALWYSGGEQITGNLPSSFYDLAIGRVAGIPLPALYMLGLALLLWVVLDHTPMGRALYAIGANPKAAELNGIRARNYTMWAFISSGAITAFAGVVLAARLRIGQASVGLEYLLPALVGAFLGSTTIKPGRVNVWGTVVGVAILAVGISGIQQLGGAFWVEPLFNGVTLVASIGAAGWAQKRRLEAIKRQAR